MTKLLLALLISLPIAAYADTVTVDKYTGITSKVSSPIKLSDSRTIKLTKVEDKRPPGLSAVVLTYMKDGAYDFKPLSQTREFVNDNRGYLMIDSEPVLLGDGIYEGKAHFQQGSHYINENVGYILKPEVISKITAATKIEGRIGSRTEFTLTPAQVETVKQFATQ